MWWSDSGVNSLPMSHVAERAHRARGNVQPPSPVPPRTSHAPSPPARMPDTALRIMSPQKIPPVRLVRGICLCQNADKPAPTTGSKPTRLTTSKHPQNLSALTPLRNAHVIRRCSHLFRTPNTFAHIFLRISVSISQSREPGWSKVASRRIILRSRTIRRGAVLLRPASAPNNWLRSGCCVAPPTQYERGFLLQVTLSSNLF